MMQAKPDFGTHFEEGSKDKDTMKLCVVPRVIVWFGNISPTVMALEN